MRLCMVGCGAIAQRHSAAIRLVNGRGSGDEVTVTVAVDPVLESAAALATDFADHGCVSYRSLEEALEGASSSFDAVLLMVPPALNQELMSLALRHDKSVLLQKPLAISEAKGLALLAEVDALRAAGHHRTLLVSEHSQWWPEVLTIRRLIQEGRIGELVTARSLFAGGLGGIADPNGWRRSVDAGGGGIAMDGGTHWLRPLRMWFGEVVGVSGTTAQLTPECEGETMAKAILHHESKRVTTFDAIALPEPAVFSPQPHFVVTGTAGEIVMNPGLTPITAEEIFPASLSAESAECVAHIARLSAGGWLHAPTVTPQEVRLYTTDEPGGVDIPSSFYLAGEEDDDGTAAALGEEEARRGGTLEAFVNEMAAFAAAVEEELQLQEGGEGAPEVLAKGAVAALPVPKFSLGEVAIAQALYRSAAAGGQIESVVASASAL